MLLKFNFKKISIFSVLFILISTIVYSQSEKQNCDVSEMRDALRQALFEFFESPNDAKFSVTEIKDFLDFYISTNASQTNVDCSGTGPRSKKAYHQMLGLAKKIAKEIPKCSDGTEYGKCSSNVPNYCYGGKIVERCKICGCKENEKCDKHKDQCVPLSPTEMQEVKPKVKHVKKPKITDIEPSSGAVGTKITLTGSGFTDDNSIFIRGRTVLRGIPSPDGSSIEFVLPDNTKCLPEHGKCPIKVVNINGISNAKPFKVTEAIIMPPEPLPEPEPNITVTPPPVLLAPNITSISPSFASIGSIVTLSGSGFTSTDNAINLAGVNNAITGLSSADGVTLKFNAQTPCEPLKACSVSVTNSRGTSNIVYFTLTQVAPQVNIVQPNGGEKFIQGQSNSITWTGGKDAVQVALVEDIADSSSDPSDLIVGWINSNALPDSSTNWDAKQVCTQAGDSCWSVEPGSYKILAVSENELGSITISPDGRGNFDVSNQPFTIAKPLNPTITMLAPNGGATFIRGFNMSVSWSATDIISKSVTINLLKAGAFNLRIATNLSMPSDTGIFSITWTVPSSIAPATDYSIEVLDSANANVHDISDSPFSISSGLTVTVLSPNGGETWIQGFKGYVFWNFTYYYGSMTLNLLKGGSVYKTLITNVQRSYFSGYSFENPFQWYIPFALVNISPDMPVGSDYGVEIVNSYDPTLKDASNAPFNIITLPNPVTFSGRFIDRFTQKPLANQGYYTYANPAPYPAGALNYTNSNGEFLFTATTTELTSDYASRMLYVTWPKCYMAQSAGLFRSPQMIYVSDNTFDARLLRQSKYQSVTKPEMSLGDIPFWPAVDIKVQTDTPVKFFVYYSDGYNSGGGAGNIGYLTSHYLSNSVPLNLDVWTKLIDDSGKVYYSPPVKLSLDYGCSPKVLSYFNGNFKWEPYYINFWAYGFTGTEGVPIGYNTPYLSGGVKPYTFNVIYGSLPPGLSLNPSNGTISGIPTTAGVYKFTVKATDSNGVNAVVQSQIQIQTPSGIIPPLIEVRLPSGGDQLYQGNPTYVQWSSYNLLSRSVKINLLKGGNFYSTILSNFSQSWPTGGFSYLWNTPKDIPPGADYKIEISDATNPSVKDTNDVPFWFVNVNTGASWSCCSSQSKYNQWLRFAYPGTISGVQSFKIYEKRPDSSSFKLVATFTNIPLIANCSGRWGTSGSWQLTVLCSVSPTLWYAYSNSLNSSSYPTGEYAYQLTAVDNLGVESAPFITLKQYALEKVALLSPTSVQSPVNATPTFEWTVPQDWPSVSEKSFYVEVYDTPYNRVYLKYISPVIPDARTTKTIYDGPALDPSKKYLAQVSGISYSIFDNASLSYMGYVAMSNATNTFWVQP